MKDPGDLLYCKKRGNIRCCFENAVCTEFMEWGSDDLEKATSYLNETLAYLNGLVKSTGYSSCHHLGTSLDTSKCAKDCEKLKRQEFANNCTADGGLFKCCIRRDKARCHECR